MLSLNGQIIFNKILNISINLFFDFIIIFSFLHLSLNFFTLFISVSINFNLNVLIFLTPLALNNKNKFLLTKKKAQNIILIN